MPTVVRVRRTKPYMARLPRPRATLDGLQLRARRCNSDFRLDALEPNEQLATSLHLPVREHSQKLALEVQSRGAAAPDLAASP
jgi:hypothetical protein